MKIRYERLLVYHSTRIQASPFIKIKYIMSRRMETLT